jgi:ubiquitin C-terminal hydrolase
MFVMIIYSELDVSFVQCNKTFSRGAVNLGTKDSPVYQIEIYMLPFRCHIVSSKDFVIPDVNEGVKWNVSKNCTFGLVCSDILRQKKGMAYNYRCWVRRHKPKDHAPMEIGVAEEPTATADADYVKVEKADTEPMVAEAKEDTQPFDSQETVIEGDNMDVSSANGATSPPPEGILPSVRRQLTADIVEVDGEWRLFRKPDRVSVMDICVDDGGMTELLIEPGPNYYSAHTSELDWPRSEQALAWQKDLRVGDEVDCCDARNTWLEAVIVAVNEDKSVRVHFKGWNSTFDETVPADKVPSKVAPLFSNVKNWRANIEEDDKVDVRVEVEGKHVWVLATVQEINVPEKKILVMYTGADVVAAANPAAASKNRHYSSFDDIDDDDKPLSLMDGGAKASASTEDKKEKVEPAAPAIHQVWRSIDGEDVCDAYMHTPKRFTSTYMSRGYDDVYGEKNTTGKPISKGVVGLQNLGNTCFMNSVLQCMSNTYALTDFFVSNRYKPQLNTTNVLGHKGEVAKSYAKLMKDMWCDGYTKVVPRNFKRTIGEFQPQFAGYAQQDSQEFLGFLLDGLHEDLNRIQKSPYVPKIDSNGREDLLIARESWRRFLLRNDSALVDKVYGQLRSHVTCASCGKESVTFDAFNSLSLPVPIKTSKVVTVTVRTLPLGSVPLKLNVAVDLTDHIGDLRVKVVRQLKRAGHLADYDVSKVKRITGYAVKVGEDSSRDTVSSVVVPHWATADNAADDMDLDDSNKVSSDDANKNKVHGNHVHTSNEFVAADKAQYEARRAALQAGERDLEPIFHVVAHYEHDQYKPAKNLDDKSPVGDLLRGRETVVLYQLEHPCSVKSKTDSKKYVSFVDLLFCVKKGNTDTLDTFTYGERINVTKDTTPADLYLLADQSFNRIVQKSSEYYQNPEKRPFVLFVKSIHEMRPRRTLDPADTKPIAFDEFESIAMQLLAEANLKTHIITTEIGRTEMLNVSADDDEDDADADNHHNNHMHGQKKNKGLTVYKCLDKFVEREQLNEAETIYCSKCKQHLAPVKKMDLWATPDVLVIHLKRFQYVPGQYFVHRDKISDFIDFPVENLDLTEYVKGPQDSNAPPIYDLYGVSHHSGGLGGGHYTAICKNPLNNNWCVINKLSKSMHFYLLWSFFVFTGTASMIPSSNRRPLKQLSTISLMSCSTSAEPEN